MYDTLIIGGGPIGLTCGIEAKKNNLDYIILEKGCLVNSIYHFPTNMTFFSTSQKIEIGDVPFVTISDKPTRGEALEYYRRVKDYWQLNIKTYEAVENVINHETHFEVTSNKKTYLTKSVIVSTGFYDIPNLLKVPGEDLPKVKHYFDDPHPYTDHKVIVVGAGNSAADVALETYYKNAKVTMVVRKHELKRKIKYWVLPNIENRIKEGSIKAYYNSRLVAIREYEADIETPEGIVTIENDFVLAMTGYQPNFDFLSKMGISFSEDGFRTPTHDEVTFETNVKNLFLAGVVCGGMQTNKWFIENGRFHAEGIFRTILERQ